jgi:uncharacterized protein
MANTTEIVKKINEAFLKGDTDGFLSHCDENVVWTMVGDTQKTGVKNIKEWMGQMEGNEPPKFKVKRIIADDTSAACYGDMTMKNQNGEPVDYAYCDLYVFKGDKVTEMTSYVIATTKDDKNKSASA